MPRFTDAQIEAELASDRASSDEDDDIIEEDIHEDDIQSVQDEDPPSPTIFEAAMDVEDDRSAIHHQLVSPSTVNIGNTVFDTHGNHILMAQNRILKGKEKRSHPTYKWSSMPPPPHRVPGRNIVPYLPGPVGAAKVVTNELSAFELFFDSAILEIILIYTNKEIDRQKSCYGPTATYIKELNMIELRAYIGILVLTAVKKDNRVSTKFLWCVCGSEIYAAAMPKDRFNFLTNCLRFDDRSTREVRKATDEFAPVRDIWEQLMKNCTNLYRPSVNCTIDEQLVGFRGRCKFRIYIPSKPDKYGLKMVLMCDANNRYVVSGMPYLGSGTPNGTTPLAEYFVENLTVPVHYTNINITYDNWFTSVPLANKMLSKYKLTTVGTLRKNKVEIPPDSIAPKNRPVGSSVFLYNSHDKLQLTTYCPKKGKMVVLLSNMHYETAISEPSGKPEVVEFYNSTKAGVDAVDQMCHSYSCSRRTKRWPLAIFYNMVDIAGINSHTVLNINNVRNNKTAIPCADFLYKLALSLMLPFMKERLKIVNLRHNLKNKIDNIITEHQKLCSNENNPERGNELVASTSREVISPQQNHSEPGETSKKIIKEDVASVNPKETKNLPLSVLVAQILFVNNIAR